MTHEHRDFTLERTYRNCRDHVWAAWTIPEKKAAWFGDGLRDLDFRVGGTERGEFRDEIGLHVNETRFFEIADRRRIVLAYSMALNDRVHTVSLATITFADADGGTTLTYHEQMCVIPPSDGVDGREHGWSALLDSLEGYLAADTIANAGKRP